MPSPFQNDIPEQILALPEQVTRSSESRLQSAEDARKALFQLLKEDEPRSYQRAIVKGCYDGNSPYNEKRRRQDGNGWMCNLNFMGLEGTVDNARIPYYALYSGVPTYATFKTRYRAMEPDASRWNLTIADKFTCLLTRWRQFKWHMQASQFEMLFEGWGPLLFEDDHDWRFSAKPARAVLVPQGSPSCLDDRVPYIAIKCEYRIHQLYKHIRNEESAAKRGWDVKAVQWAIKNGTRGQSGDVTNMRDQPWEEWQKRYKNKELTSSYTEFDIINCAHLYVLEYTGKVSHFIVTLDANGAPEDAKGFLFKDVNRYDSYAQAMNVAFQNTGDGTWHSVRGVGLKSFKFEETRNRLNCKMVDNAHLASGIMLQSGDAKSDQKLQLKITGPVTYIPPGTTFIDRQQMSGNLEAAMGVSRYLEAQLAQKIGAFNQRSMGREDGRGEQPTATQVQYAAAKEGSLNASQIDNYYLDLDAIYSEVYRRVLISSDPEAKRFIQDCLAEGVPMEALRDMEYVRANRLSGYGSPQMRKMAMEEMAQVVPMLPEDGKNAWLNDKIAAAVGPDKIGIYNPPLDKPDVNAAMAVMENSMMHDGDKPLVISGMDHAVHLQIHLADADERMAPLMEAVELGQDIPPEQLQEAYDYATVLGEHCDEHLNAIENDPSRKGVAEVFKGQLNLIFSFHGKLRSALRRIQAEGAQEAREAENIVALDQVKLASAQQQMEIEAAEAQQGMQIKEQKAQHQNALKRWQVGQKNQLDTISTAEKLRLERIKTASTVQQNKMSGSSNAKKAGGSK